MISTVTTLDHLSEGQFGYITNVSETGMLKRRLWDLGIVEGTKVYCAHKGPFGDPVAYQVRGAVIALRKDDSRNIQIEL